MEGDRKRPKTTESVGIIMQFYRDVDIYFSVLPRDFVENYLRRFCCDYGALQQYMSLEVSFPTCVAFDLDDNLVVSLYWAHEVHVYSREDGSFIRQIGQGWHRHPAQCAVDKTGRVYVSEVEGIRVFRPDYDLDKITWIHFGERAFDIAIDDDKLYVCTRYSLKIFDISTYWKIGQIGMEPYSVAVIPTTKQLVIAERKCVKIFGCGGGTLEHTFPVDEHCSNRLAVDVYGNIYVIYAQHYDICVFTNKGHKIGIMDTLFSAPQCIAISQRTGVVVVSDAHGIHFHH